MNLSINNVTATWCCRVFLSSSFCASEDCSGLLKGAMRFLEIHQGRQHTKL